MIVPAESAVTIRYQLYLSSNPVIALGIETTHVIASQCAHWRGNPSGESPATIRYVPDLSSNPVIALGIETTPVIARAAKLPVAIRTPFRFQKDGFPRR